MTTAKPLSSFLSGKLDVNVLLSFLFGCVFISVMLVFARFTPNPDPLTQQIFIVVLALAAAGVAAMIPGILHIKSKGIRAGGALGVFVIVFFFKPAIVTSVGKFVPPTTSAMVPINAYLEKIDNNDLSAAWNLLDKAAKETVAKDVDMYRAAYKGAREPLGKMLSRTQLGHQMLESPPGYPAGLYQLVTFRTKFESGRCYLEMVSVRATDEIEWKVFLHNINMNPVPC